MTGNRGAMSEQGNCLQNLSWGVSSQAESALKDTKTGGWDRREDIAWYITNETARTAEFYAAAIRGHWGIENRDHRVRDGAFAEDASRIRVNPSICARVRSIALNIFRFNQVENVATEQWRNAMSIDRALAYNGPCRAAQPPSDRARPDLGGQQPGRVTLEGARWCDQGAGADLFPPASDQGCRTQ